MDPYTIEDIEMLRQKSGLSYQEAVALLDYHNGSPARALIDLEQHGRLHEETQNGKEGKSAMSGNEKKNETREKTLNFLQKLYRTRVKIRKGDTSIFNVSVLFAGICLLFAPHMTIAGIIVSLILGYQFSLTSMDPDFASDSLEKMVKNAAQNARSSVSSVVHTIQTETKERQKKEPEEIRTDNDGQKAARTGMDAAAAAGDQDDPAESIRKQAKEIEETMDSFFDSNPAANKCNSAYSAAASSVPTIQVPVQTETRDGSVTQEDDQDGYSSVTIG